MTAANDAMGNGACNLPACSCSASKQLGHLAILVVSVAELENWDIAKCD